MNQSVLSFTVRSTHRDLKLTVKLNDQVVLEPELSLEPNKYSITFDDIEDYTYKLGFELSGKTSELTRIDESGNIIADEIVEINEIDIDDININQLFFDKAKYRHDFNGTKDPINDRFFGTMGCNGVISFEFTTPFYLWLLENM